MRVTEVSVSVHEKRNHPTEYGHRDCSVQIVASVEHLESADVVARELLGKATAHVQRELDVWIDDIEFANAQAIALSKITDSLFQMTYATSDGVDRLIEEMIDAAVILPANERVELLDQAQWAADVRRDELSSGTEVKRC